MADLSLGEGAEMLRKGKKEGLTGLWVDRYARITVKREQGRKEGRFHQHRFSTHWHCLTFFASRAAGLASISQPA
jgi:hypothetical protein